MSDARNDTGRACLACGQNTWQLLIDSPHAMLSDGKCLPYRLQKQQCMHCGLLAHLGVLPESSWDSLFAEDYALHSKLPTEFDRQRAASYADWLLPLLHGESPLSCLELGCGNGALLEIMNQRLALHKAYGLDPNGAAVAVGCSLGLSLIAGVLGGANWQRSPAANLRFDLVYSINVLEHVLDPLAFLRGMRKQLAEDGRMLIVCPDGELPGSEMLMFDHQHSFTLSALESMLDQAGLVILCHERSPAHMPGFQALLAAVAPVGPWRRTANEAMAGTSLFARRSAWLRNWWALDQPLPVSEGKRYIAFGVGEAAMLLRTYAPRLWAGIDALTADVAPPAGRFGLPFIAPADLKPESDCLLLATRNEVQAALATRLRAQGFSVMRIDEVYAHA